MPLNREHFSPSRAHLDFDIIDAPTRSPPQHPPARYVAMKDSWSHGDDRRDRGRVDRGVARTRTSRSPPARRHESDRETTKRDRSPVKLKPRPAAHRHDRSRERSREQRRRTSRSPRRDSGEAVRERNRGRELLDTRGSDKPKRSTTHHSPSSSKRRHSRSLSLTRNHHKKSRRDTSRSPSRAERGSSRPEKKHRTLTPPPPRRRSTERRPTESQSESKYRSRRDSGPLERRGRSPSPRHGRQDRHDVSRRDSPSRKENNSRRDRSPVDRTQKPRERSLELGKDRDRKRAFSPKAGRRSPDTGRYEPSTRARQRSPGPPRGSKSSRGRSPRHRDERVREGKTKDERPREERSRDEKPRDERPRDEKPREDRSKDTRRQGDRPRDERSKDEKPGHEKAREGRPRDEDYRDQKAPRDEYRPSKAGSKGYRPAASGANSIEVKSSRASPAASGANSVEVKSEKGKMNGGRGYYGGHQGYNPHQQMQAAFPLKPQFNQAPPVDPRQYSQSPQHHMTPNSYHGSPQAQSPYSAGRGGWSGQQQYSPQQQYSQNYQQQQSNYSSPGGPQVSYYNNQSPPYQMTPSGPMNQPYQQNFRGNQRGYRGNHFNNNMRGGRGDFRGGRGAGHFQNLHWNASNGPAGAGRGQHNSSGPATPQHASPQQQYPPASAPAQSTAQPQSTEPEEDEFRPSKEHQVEEKESAKKENEEKMPPPKATPTGPQSGKVFFTMKNTTKPTPTTPKLEISQKLTVAPRKDVQLSPERSRGSAIRSAPTEPASARRSEFRAPPVPTTRKVKKIMKRPKERPQLTDDFKKSDSVYYRKPGNESVIGSGTFGKVFKAIHVYTKDLVALKKIRMEGERDGFPVTAVREIKLLQSLKHHNIVNLHEVMVEKNDCFMVFEYLSHDLTGLLNHPSFKLEPAHKKHLAKQLLEGLDYLHRRGVLHRDIKAANILVSNEGQLKIADFGLARFYAKQRQLDYTNRVITIWYRSPELLLGETQYGPAVDIWSAACVLVEIFTRHAIFPGDGGEISQLEKIYAILGTPKKSEWPGLVDMQWFELLRPSVKRPNVFADKYKERVTPEAYELLEAMFQYDPAKRPSASDVLEHPYFTVEEPKPRQAIELSKLEGDWHEFESKALRKENEKKDKEARRQAQKDAVVRVEKEKKRALEGEAAEREAKRLQMAPPSLPGAKLTEAKK